MDVTIDGSTSPTVSRTTNSTASYANLFYQSSSMQSIWHTVIITNIGGPGTLDFEFDRVVIDANDIVPTIAPFTAPVSSASSSSQSPTQSPTQSTTQSSSSSAHTVPVRTVVGIVVGVIGFLILFLLLVLCLRRRKAKTHWFTLMGASSDNSTRSRYIQSCLSPISHHLASLH